ncbi:hypothetical protein RJ639_033001 [Escallonia herrerae]|uniref:OTU domain-containing protein n=1 Tax=Escallonia herrerae TaxID=1293975 RepID=A0AA89BA82_9ASTE|nr:hypothetical protein RJ639_033001 [Escallonia herrerae]
MGKLICDSTTSSPVIPWRDPTSAPSLDQLDVDQSTTTTATAIATIKPTAWEHVSGLEDQQRRQLQRLYTKGVLWKHPESQDFPPAVVFRLSHGGDVEADGNCLFTASMRAMGLIGVSGRDLRRRTVRRFLEDIGSVADLERDLIGGAIKHMYSPDLGSGWGVHVVQEVKLLAKKEDRKGLDLAIDELVHLGMQRELAAESIYKERCIAVDDGLSWAKYMSISGCPDDEYDIITLQYTEEGLLTIDENRDGHAAAFGDDIAIECLATEFKREIYVSCDVTSMTLALHIIMIDVGIGHNSIANVVFVLFPKKHNVDRSRRYNALQEYLLETLLVQAHGSDAMVDEENCVFFLPHRPRSEICSPPFFLFMKGTGWCGAGGDHYEPLIAHLSSPISLEKVGLVL